MRGTNAAPSGTDFSKATGVDTDLAFALSDFAITDADGDALKAIEVVTLPAGTAGTLKVSGTAIVSGNLPKTVTRAELSSGALVFAPVAAFSGDATFTFKVVDAFGAAAASASTATVRVVSAPVVTAVAITSTPGADADGNGTAETYGLGEAVEVTVTWTGEVRWDVSASGASLGVALGIGAETRTAALVTGGATSGAASALKFRYTVTASDADADGIEVKSGSGGDVVDLVSGATLTDAASRAVSRAHAGLGADAAHRVRGTNAAPSGTDVSKATGVDTDLAFALADFAITDADGDALKAIRIESLPAGTAGTLKVSGTAIAAGNLPKTVSRAELSSGALVFDPVAAFSGEASFTFKVVDAFGAAAAAASTATVTVVTAPAVTAVAITSDPGVDRSYVASDVIEVRVTFDAAVTVVTTGGTPRLKLDLGAAPGSGEKWAGYESGSESRELVFAYTVVPGDASTEGVAVVASSLEANGGTLRATESGRDATLSHAGLGHDTAHRVDAVAPSVPGAPSVTSSAGADDTYAAGDTLEVTVTFDEAVTVTGTPRLEVAVGSNARQADYAGGTGSNELRFTYTVVAGDADTDGIAVAASRLALNGGSITDGPGNAAMLTHVALAAQSSHKVDGVAPVLSGATVAGATLTLTFDEALDDASEPAPGRFAVTVAGAPRTVSTVGVGARSVTLTLGSAVRSGEAVTVSYAVPPAHPVQDAAGNDAAALAARTVDNDTAPVFSSATVDGTRLEVTFDAALDATATPAGSAFTVTADAATQQPTDVAIAGAVVTLTLGTAVTGGQAVKVRYAKPASGSVLRDGGGHEVASFTDRTVTNTTAVTNSAPSFPADTPGTLAVAENNALGAPVGTVAATDADGDTLTYSLDTASDAVFDIDANGALTVTAAGALDREATASYAVTVSVSDGKAADGGADAGVDATHAVTVNVANVEEPPGAPGGLTVSAASLTSLNVSWEAPSDTGAVAVTDYDLRYYAGIVAPIVESLWVEEGETGGHTHTGTATSATLTGLAENAPYVVQVRAAGDGEGAWSGAVGARTEQVRHRDDLSGGRPRLRSAVVNGATLTLTFSEALDTSSVPGASAFTVGTLSVSRSVTAVAFDADDATKLELTVSPAAAHGDSGILLGYKKPATGRLRDTDGNEVLGFSLERVVNVTPAPVVEKAEVDGDALTVVFDKALDTGSAPAGSAFTVTATGAGGSARTIAGTGTVAIEDATVSVTLASAVVHGETVKLRYAVPGTSPLQDTASSPSKVVGFTDRVVENVTPDTTAPEVSGAEVNGATLTLAFDEALDTGSVPDKSAFTVSGTASATSVTGVAFKAGDATKVELALSPAVGHGESGITVGYIKPATSALRDTAATPNEVADFSEAVTNETPDTRAPEVASAVVNGATLTLTFDEALDTGSVPDKSAFTVSGTTSATSVTGVAFTSGDATKVELALSPAVGGGESGITVGYVKPATSALRDTAATPNEVADFSESVTNETPDTRAPEVAGAVVSGATLTLTFDEALDTGSVPDKSAFTVSGTASATSVTGVAFTSGDATKVELTLSPAVGGGESGITVGYIKPATSPLRDTAATPNEVATFSGEAVTNETDTVPSFDDGNAKTVSVAENSPADTVVGTVAASDADGDTLSYTLTSGGTDHDSFTIDGSGVIKVKAGATLDHETKPSYTVTAQVSDGEDAGGNPESGAPTIDDTIEVTINVTDVDEPPDVPTGVSVTASTTTSLTVGWTAPADTGSEAVSDYDVRYFAGAADPTSADDWVEPGETGGHDHVGTALTTTITGLTAGTAYRVQVRAEGEGEGAWSASASGSTSAANAAPTFPTGTPTTLSVDENSAGGTEVGTVAATDTDTGDTLSYSLADTVDGSGDAGSFTIDADGVIKVKAGATLDHETKPSYAVTVQVSDGKNADHGADTSIDITRAVTINLDDVDEPPGQPGAPTVDSATSNSLTVSWTAPTDVGGATVTDYDVRYFAGAADPTNADDWVEPGETGGHDHVGATTTATITGLTASTTYRVQVRATGEGTGAWSASGEGATSAPPVTHTSPSFADGETKTLTVAENSPADTTVGQVAATDDDADTLTYSLTSAGTDHDSFTIDGTGTIKVKAGATLDHETKPSYTVTARVSDGEDSAGDPDTVIDDSITVTINLDDVDEPPDAPTGVSVTASTTTSLTVGWTAPTDTGSEAVSDYDVRYFAGNADPTNAADWVEPGETGGHDHVGTATTTTITGLAAGTDYRIQVRAEGEGEGAWSASAGGSTSADTTAPALRRASVNGATLTLTFDEALDTSAAPAAGAFTVSGTASATSVTGVAFTSGDARKVELTLSSAVGHGESGITVDYYRPTGAGANPLRDGAGHEVASFAGESVTNRTPDPTDTTAPQVQSASMNGATLKVVFDEVLDDASTPPGSAFFLTFVDLLGSEDRVIFGTDTAVAIDGRIVTVALASEVAPGERWRLDYVAPASNPLRDVSGNAVASYTGRQAVRNDTPASGRDEDRNRAPRFPATAPTTLEVAENSAADTEVGTVAATDADGDTLTYSLTSAGHRPRLLHHRRQRGHPGEGRGDARPRDEAELRDVRRGARREGHRGRRGHQCGRHPRVDDRRHRRGRGAGQAGCAGGGGGVDDQRDGELGGPVEHGPRARRL